LKFFPLSPFADVVPCLRVCRDNLASDLAILRLPSATLIIQKKKKRQQNNFRVTPHFMAKAKISSSDVL